VLVAFVLVFGFIAVNPSHAVFTKLGMSGAQFLKIGVGRPTGMGDAFVAVADDASATYWNPAGIAMLPRNEVLLNHNKWIADINHEYISIVTPTAAGSFGFAVTALSMGEIEETTIDEFEGTGRTFSASDLAFGVSYARKFTDKFSFGLTAKVVQEQIWDMSAAGAAFDFGVYYNTGMNNLRLAMAISNFGPDLRFSGKQLQFDYDPGNWTWPWTRTPLAGELLTETYPLPVLFRFGFAYDIISVAKARLTAAADLVHYNDVNEKINLGLEADVYGLKLRGGYVFNTDLDYGKDVGYASGLSAGAGVTLHPFGRTSIGVDYGIRDLGRLGLSHRVNVNVGF
jgi:hypothetical protein